jgi:hypothetical protein
VEANTFVNHPGAKHREIKNTKVTA